MRLDRRDEAERRKRLGIRDRRRRRVEGQNVRRDLRAQAINKRQMIYIVARRGAGG